MPWRELANDYSIVNALREKAPDGYGLGASNGRPIPPTVEGGLNTATQNGWYYFGGAGGIQNIPSLIPSSDYGYLLVSSRNEQEKLQVFMSEVNNYIAVRKLEAGVWQPWEYVNPPMDLGVEYRTTERYLGKPVYVKVVDCGSCPADGYKNVMYGEAYTVMPIRCEGTWSYSGRSTIPFESTDEDQLHIGALGNVIRVKTGGKDFSSYTCTATVYYAKATD